MGEMQAIDRRKLRNLVEICSEKSIVEKKEAL